MKDFLIFSEVVRKSGRYRLDFEEEIYLNWLKILGLHIIV